MFNTQSMKILKIKGKVKQEDNEKVPIPPKLPPPEQKIRNEEKAPTISLPNIDFAMPKIEFPEGKKDIKQLSEADKPSSLPQSQKSKETKPNIKQEPQKTTAQDTDNFVFSEVSLKDFVGGIKDSASKSSEEKSKTPKSNVVKTLREAKPQTTISLFNLGGDAQPKKRPLKEVLSAPPGVPVISNWRKNRDGSVSGFISGSKSFEDGDAITTSPISTGNIKEESLVETGSGSK